MRIGLFGGTFNPIHLGHITVSRELLALADLDIIYFIPAAVPPHKDRQHLADSEHRLEMIRLALHDEHALKVSDVEMQRPGFSYTIDTVNHFLDRHGEEDRLFLIMGGDAFIELDSWRSYDQLLEKVAFLVMTRPGLGYIDWKSQIQEYLGNHISADYRFVDEPPHFQHPVKKPVFLLEPAPVDISSTLIRERIRNGDPVSALVSPVVEGYIESKGLYK